MIESKHALDFIFTLVHNNQRRYWDIVQTPEFKCWYKDQDIAAKEDIYVKLLMLAEVGPSLGRPQVDTVKGSKFKNMKELRIQSLGRPLRVLFVFDPGRNAVLLMGGNKKGKKRFYEKLIHLADQLYERHLKERKYE